jgi:hypothetical protein
MYAGVFFQKTAVTSVSVLLLPWAIAERSLPTRGHPRLSDTKKE